MRKKDEFRKYFIERLVECGKLANKDVEKLGDKVNILGSTATRYAREIARSGIITHPVTDGKIDEFNWVLNTI